MDMSNAPTVSICIPTYNSASYLKSLIPVLQQQSVVPDNIIIVDSNSHDGSESVARQYGCFFYSIGDDGFDHGLTRNKFIDLTDSEIQVYITDDAMPENNDWLQNLIDPLINDNELAACVGPQGSFSKVGYYVRDWLVVRKNATFQTVFCIDQEVFPVADNCNTAYRAEILRKYPFKKTAFGEDLVWSKQVKDDGYRIHFQSTAGVYHYHKKRISYYLNRSAHSQKALYELFDIDLGSDLRKSLKCFKVAFSEYLLSRRYVGVLPWLMWMPYAIGVSVLKVVGCRRYFKKNINNDKAVYRNDKK